MPVGDGGDGVGEDDGRVGGHAAPIAGVHAAGPHVDLEVEMEAAAGAGAERGDARVDARAVAGEQHVGAQLVLVGGDDLGEALGAALLAGLDDQLDVVAELAAALGQHGLQRGEVDDVLALIVGGAAAVPAVARAGQAPGVEAGLPLILQAADRVAMAVGDDGRAGALDAFGEQDRAAALHRVGVDGAGEAELLEPGQHALVEVGVEVRAVARLLAGAADGDELAEPFLEPAAIEERQRLVDRACPRAVHAALRVAGRKLAACGRKGKALNPAPR